MQARRRTATCSSVSFVRYSDFRLARLSTTLRPYHYSVNTRESYRGGALNPKAGIEQASSKPGCLVKHSCARNRFRGTFHERQVPVPLSCEIVGLFQPADHLCINIVDGAHTNAVGEERIEARSGLETLGRGDILEDEPEVDARRCRRLDHGKLLFAAQTHIALFQRRFNIVAKGRDRRHQRIVERIETGLLATVQLGDRIATGSLRSFDKTCRIRLARLESHAMRGAVRHAVMALQHGDDLGVFGEAAPFDKSDPLA